MNPHRLLAHAQRHAARNSWRKAILAAGLACLEDATSPVASQAFALLASIAQHLGDEAAGEAYQAIAAPSEQSPSTTATITESCPESTRERRSPLLQASATHTGAESPSTVFHLIAGGDVMLGRQMPGWTALRGFSDPLADLAPALQSADLACVNLEVCVCTVGDFINKGGRQPYYFHCPPEMLAVLTGSGIHCVCSANNHAMDFGSEALEQHLAALAAAGITSFGAGRTAKRAALPRIVHIKGQRVAWIGVETETPVMAATRCTAGVNHASYAEALRKVGAAIAVARAAADWVIVSPHWGENWRDTPTVDAVALAKCWIDLGADAVLGHSAHILQGVAFHRGCPIAFDMGTLLFDRVAQETMRFSALFDLRWDAQRRCTVTLRPVRLHTARATWASGDDQAHILQTFQQLNQALDPQTIWRRCDEVLQATGGALLGSWRTLNSGAHRAKLPPTLHAKAPPSPRNDWLYRHLAWFEGRWLYPIHIDENLTILGARIASPVRAGRGFLSEVYFRANAAQNHQRLEARIAAFDAQGHEVFAYIHPVAEGVCPPGQWHKDTIVCDRICVRPVQRVSPGRYRLGWNLIDLQSGQLYPIQTSAQILMVQQHVILGEWQVSEDAPPSVAGLAAPPYMRPLPDARREGDWINLGGDFWQQVARPWVQASLEAKGITLLDASPHIVRNTPSCWIASVQSSAGAHYFKAVAGDSGYESALATWLQHHALPGIARVLNADTNLGFILSADHGQELATFDRSTQLRHWQQLLPQLARAQIATFAHVESLLQHGVPDARLNNIEQSLRYLLDDRAALRIGQTDGLTNTEYQAALRLVPTLRAVCQHLRQDAWSTALDHGDLHARNILVQHEAAHVVDWDNAWVSHPFCVLLQLYHAEIQRKSPDFARLQALYQTYLQPWQEHTHLPMAALQERLQLALWVAHALRALLWTRAINATETVGERPLLMVCKWINLWVNRAADLVPSTRIPTLENSHADQVTATASHLASAANPLLLTPELIAACAGGYWIGGLKDIHFTGISFNRRYMQAGITGNLYVAAHHDPRHHYTDAQLHAMAHSAKADGAIGVLLPQRIQNPPSNLAVLQIPDEGYVLEKLGTYVRDHLFNGRRVLISGTEGKTGFKNMLRHVLSPQVPAHAMKCSANLDFALWASLASLRQNDQVAILEAAGTHPGRLARRSQIAQPHIAILTEVGNEHINFHGSQEAVIASKANIVTGMVEGGYVILNADSRNYAATRQAVLARKRVPIILFGSAAHCNGRLLGCEFQANGWNVRADIEGQRVDYRLPLLGEHTPLASVSVLLTAYYLGANVVEAAAAFSSFKPYESQGALRRLALQGGEILCFDNASRASVLSYQSTLATVARLQPPHPQGKKIGVIGQMIFLGNESAHWHRQLAQWVDAARFDHIILVGTHTAETFANLQATDRVIARFYDYDRRQSDADALNALVNAILAACSPGDLLFIKGELDEVGEYLRRLEKPLVAQAAPALTPSPQPPKTSAPTQSVPPTPDATIFSDWHPLTPSDAARVRAAFAEAARTTWTHYFPFLALLHASRLLQLWVVEDTGSLCIFRLRTVNAKPELSLFLLPMPHNDAVLQRCLERIRTFNKAPVASIFRVDEADAVHLRKRPQTRVVACPPEFVYNTADFQDLSGNKKRNLRRAVTSIEALEGLEVLPYQTRFASDCMGVFQRWRERHQAKYGGALGGNFTPACLRRYDEFSRQDLTGIVIRIQGVIQSFGFAGEMHPGMGNLFIAYSDHTVDGLHKFLYYQLAQCVAHLPLANASHGNDRDELVQAKQLLRPAFMAQPYQIYMG